MYYWGLVYRSFDEVRWKIGVDDVKGGGDHPRGLSLSPLNELSFELSGGSNGKVVVELSGSRWFGSSSWGSDGSSLLLELSTMSV